LNIIKAQQNECYQVNNKDCVSWPDLVPLYISLLFVTQNEEQFTE